MFDRKLLTDAPISVLRGVDPMTTLPLIERIMSLSRSATGALLFGSKSHPDGAILVEGGRVCWAAAPKMRRRLTDLLKAHIDPALGPDALEELVHRCRADNTPLGETLVGQGYISSDDLRRTLRQQTSEAILFLSQSELDPPAWVSHRQQRYDARFTFSAVEILASVGAACLPALAEKVRPEIELVLRLGGSAVAFTWVGVSAELFPIGEERGAGLTIRETFELGKWAISMLSVQPTPRESPRLVAALGAQGDAVVAWISEGIIYVVICPNPASLAHVLGMRARIVPGYESASASESGS